MKKKIHQSTLIIAFAIIASYSGRAQDAQSDVQLPLLSISKAAEIAESSLQKIAHANQHYIKSLILNGNGTAYYAMIEPALPADPADPEGKKITITVSMDGTVHEHAATMSTVRTRE